MTKELTKWADDFMFEAEPSHAADGPKAYLLSAPVDPLGGVAACAKMYKGEVVRDLRDVTNEEREEYLAQVQKTVLGMPLEAVQLHFMLEGVHRGITHQLVRQRTAAYAQESTRFAVKRDLTDATALPPSLMHTLSIREAIDKEMAERLAAGLTSLGGQNIADIVRNNAKGDQKRRFEWDEAVEKVGEVYNKLVDDGMPAEEARGLMPTNITTRLNYITNLRNFLTEMGKRLSDQAQFEWRQVAAAYAKAMREYGKTHSYWTRIPFWEYQSWQDATSKYGPIYEREFVNRPGQDNDLEPDVYVKLSSEWQYNALTESMKPIELIQGKRSFGANFDRPSRIGERIDAFVNMGVPVDVWTTVGSPEHNIPPIHPAEWLTDPDAARLQSNQEFDIFGQRVTKGTAWHWSSEKGGVLYNIGADGRTQYANLHDGPSFDIDDVIEEVTS